MDMTRWSDQALKDKINENFGFITGETRPVDKGKNKNVDKGPEEWFQELSFLHVMIFMHSFEEATRRGILNAVEQAAGDEVIAMIREE